MTGARRIPRGGGSKNESVQGDETLPMQSVASGMPTHTTLPNVPRFGEVSFQLGLLCHSIVIIGYQHLNLYNTIYWMPNSPHEFLVDITKINYDMVVLVVLFLSHRVLYATCNMVYHHWAAMPALIIKYVILFVYYLSCGLTLWKLSLIHTTLQTFALMLPFGVYFMLFAFDYTWLVKKYLPKRFKTLSGPLNPLDYIPKPTETSSSQIFHACSPDPQTVRFEVHLLRSDFNYRLKLVYFETIKCVYYATLVPLIFCESRYHLDIYWLILYVSECTLATALLCFTHRITANYLDTMHRSAMHLGNWIKLEGRHSNIPFQVWSELKIWPKGVLVKHSRGTFKADSAYNTAEPGQTIHAKFYLFFKRPDYLCGVTFVTALLFVIFQFGLLVHYTHWYQLFSTATLMFPGYLCVYLSLRDYLITSRVYSEHVKKV